MTEGKVVTRVSKGIGDAAVDGLLRGVAAGLAMALVLAVSGLFAQLSIGFVLSRFDPTSNGSALTGLLAHLATAGIYGVIFALLTAPIAARLGVRLVLVGLVYGVILLLISRGVIASEVGAPLRSLPVAGWTLAHLVYGVTLGWLMMWR